MRQDAREEEEEHADSNSDAENSNSLGDYVQENNNLDEGQDYAVNKPAGYLSFMAPNRSAWQPPKPLSDWYPSGNDSNFKNIATLGN